MSKHSYRLYEIQQRLKMMEELEGSSTSTTGSSSFESSLNSTSESPATPKQTSTPRLKA